MMMAAAGWIVNAAVLAWLACRTTARLPPGPLDLRIGAGVVYWAFWTTLVMLVSGWTGLLFPWGIHLVTLAIAGLWVFLTRHMDSACEAAATMDRHVRVIVAAIAGVVLVRHLVHAWFLPPYVYDVLTYHLPKVAEWIQAGRIVTPETSVLRSHYPANFELLQAWCMVFLHHDVLVEVAGIPFHLLAAVSVSAMARACGASPRLAAVAALVYALTPAVLQGAVSAKNDMAITGCFLFAVAVLVSPADRREWRGRVLALAAALAFAAGTKPTIFFMAPGIAVLVLIRARDVCRAVATGWGRGDAAPLFVALLACAVVAGSWYLRNLLLFGNPLYPASIAGVVGETDAVQQGSFRWMSLVELLRDMGQQRLWDGAGPPNPELAYSAGWGWVVVTLGLPASILALASHGAYRRIAAAFAISFAFLFCMVISDRWSLRFATWTPALFVLGIVVFWRSTNSPSMRAACAILVAAGSLMNIAAGINNGYATPKDWRARIRTPWRERNVWTSEDAALALVPRGQTLGFNVHGNEWVYPLYGPALDRRLRYLPFVRGQGPSATMDSAGVAYVYIPGAAHFEPGLSREIHSGLVTQLAGNIYRRVGASTP